MKYVKLNYLNFLAFGEDFPQKPQNNPKGLKCPLDVD